MQRCPAQSRHQKGQSEWNGSSGDPLPLPLSAPPSRLPSSDSASATSTSGGASAVGSGQPAGGASAIHVGRGAAAQGGGWTGPSAAAHGDSGLWQDKVAAEEREVGSIAAMTSRRASPHGCTAVPEGSAAAGWCSEANCAD